MAGEYSTHPSIEGFAYSAVFPIRVARIGLSKRHEITKLILTLTSSWQPWDGYNNERLHSDLKDMPPAEYEDVYDAERRTKLSVGNQEKQSPSTPVGFRCGGWVLWETYGMWRWLLVAVVVLVGVGVMLWAFQRQLIYFPSGAVGNIPAGVEEVRYPTADGLELTGWFVPSNGPPEGTIIVFPGNAGNRSGRVPLARALADAGYGVLLVDYRGFGGNPGSPSESGLRLDARAALTYLNSRVDPDTIIYFGESLGSGVAVELAAEHPPAAVVLRSPFTSLDAVASVHYPYLPVSLLLWDRFDNAATIRDVEAPILIIAGSRDRTVPTELSRELYEHARDPKELVIIDGVDHNDPALFTGTEMIDAVTGFLDRVTE